MASTTSPCEIERADGTIDRDGFINLTGTFFFPAVVDATNLPTADPAVLNQVYVADGVLTVSTGP